MRVLIAEDDPIYRFLLEKVIKEKGHTPLACSDGAEALSILSGKDPPEIAILDWMMPKMDGPEVCQRVREIVPAMPVYIILLTARTHPEDVMAGLSAGADDYITKPFHKQDLLARVQVGVRVANLQRSLADRVQDLEVVLTRLRQMQQTQKLDALGQMASGLAHEINTPTQYISENIKFVQKSWNEIGPILERTAGDLETAYLIQEVPKALAESLQGVEKIGQLVRAMRDFSHSSGSEKILVDINKAVRTTVTVATNEWKYVADLAMDLDPELPHVFCLPGEIHQVLLNLIINAAHAISDAGKTRTEKGILRIATSAQDRWLQIAVSDNGAGIREEHRDKVFEPFFTTRDVGKGMGQGLTTAYSVVVQQHNGRIWFETEAGKGTTFFVRIALNGTGKKPVKAAKRILLVDDDQFVLTCLSRMLESRFDFDVALGANEALEILANRGPFAVIVSDLRMPGRSGIQLLSKAQELSPSIVGLLLSGDSAPDETNDAIKNGVVFRLLEKPCDANTLIQEIEGALTRHEGLSQVEV